MLLRRKIQKSESDNSWGNGGGIWEGGLCFAVPLLRACPPLIRLELVGGWEPPQEARASQSALHKHSPSSTSAPRDPRRVPGGKSAGQTPPTQLRQQLIGPTSGGGSFWGPTPLCHGPGHRNLRMDSKDTEALTLTLLASRNSPSCFNVSLLYGLADV